MEDLKYSQCVVIDVSLGYLLLERSTDDQPSALFTVFQIEEAAQNVLTRTMAMLSLISALMSLIYGCLYILRFSTMRTMRKAAKWAEVSFLRPNC